MAAQTITANGSLNFSLKKGTGFSTVLAFGTWGGGTLAFYISRNGTDVTLTDATGTAVTATADKAFNVTLGSDDDLTSLKATLTGATSPSLTIDVSGGRVL